VARTWLAHQPGQWEPITLHRITASLETHIFKPLGNRPVASAKPGEIMAAVKLIEEAVASDQAACCNVSSRSIDGRLDHSARHEAASLSRFAGDLAAVAPRAS